MLDHAKLDVYQRALELLDALETIQAALPAGRAHLRDQFDRASTSAASLSPARELLVRTVAMLTRLAQIGQRQGQGHAT